MNYFKLVLFAFLFFCFSPCLFAVEVTLSELTGDPALASAQWSARAIYTDTGDEIVEYNKNKSLSSASALKVLTTGVALEILGSDYRFPTRIYHDGRIKDGVLYGNIYIYGAGDPMLASSMVKTPSLTTLFARWTAAIKTKNIYQITGRIIGDESYFGHESVSPKWYWEDIGNYYAAPSKGLSVLDNSYKLFFDASGPIGSSVKMLKTDPVIPGLKIDVSNVKVGPRGSGDNAYIDCAPEASFASVRGAIGRTDEPFAIKGSIPNPALFTAQSFKDYLSKNGVKVSGRRPSVVKEPNTIYRRNRLIARHLSPPLKDAVFIINKLSNNFYAEQVLRTLGAEQLNGGTWEKGVEVIKNFLKSNGIDTYGLAMYDGCGLSRSNFITATQLTEFLKIMTKKGSFNDFYFSLPVYDDEDDIVNFIQFGKSEELAKNMRVKTGSMRGIRSYCGYLKNSSGRMIAFAFIFNNYSEKPSEIASKVSALIIKLAQT